jgi:beta-ribofuranosylaminobenzene 5'-phosphate synthase
VPVILRSYPRLHVGLLDLAHATHRDHGGAGFYINGMPAEVEVVRSRETQVVGLEGLDPEGRRDVRRAIDRILALAGPHRCAVRLRSLLPQHVGLGSKTATLLGVLQGINLELGLNLGRETIQRLSGRGGTSGVGVNAFFRGGFVADCGHPASEASGFTPSSGQSGFCIPPVVCRLRVPRDWRFHLFLLDGRRLSSRAEMAFFVRNTPIPVKEALRSIAALYHGVIPAVLGGDLGLLKTALDELHSTGFKAREVRGQRDSVKRFIRAVSQETDLAVGMSSLGPLVYAIGTRSLATDVQRIADLARKFGGLPLGTFPGRSQGYEVSA